jgi:hypothetical protein
MLIFLIIIFTIIDISRNNKIKNRIILLIYFTSDNLLLSVTIFLLKNIALKIMTATNSKAKKISRLIINIKTYITLPSIFAKIEKSAPSKSIVPLVINKCMLLLVINVYILRKK